MTQETLPQKLVRIIPNWNTENEPVCDCCGKESTALYEMAGDFGTFTLCFKLFLEQPGADQLLDEYNASLKSRVA